MRCRGDLGGVPGVFDGGGEFHLSILTTPAGPAAPRGNPTIQRHGPLLY